MFNITLRPGEQLDGKSHKFTVMADATRKKKSATSNPYDTQDRFNAAGSYDRTFQIQGRPYNRTQPTTCDTAPESPEIDDAPLRPSTVGYSSSRKSAASERPRAVTAGFGTLSCTGAFDGPYHVSPSKARPTTQFTAANDFFAATSEIEKPATMFSLTFLNNIDVKHKVQEKSEDDFVDGFMNFADLNGASVSVFDVEEIVKYVLGDDIPRWIIDIFVVMCRNKSEYRRVKLVDFRRIVPVALKAVNSYFAHSKSGPAYTKSEQVQSVRQPQQATAYRDDFESPKDIWYSTKFPMTSDIRKSTQSVSNQMLFRGTTKATQHIPGYVGHIPSNRAIKTKEVHCNGEKLRPKDHNLTLTYPVLGRLPGYVGHIPTFPINQKKK